MSFWAILCPFSPQKTWKSKILKLKKRLGDIIILHICTINDNHMTYGSWDMEHNRHNFLLFWNVFCPFTPPVDPENQNFEKMKKIPGHIIILQMCTINDSHFMYGSWDMECNRQNIHLEIWSFYICVPRIMIRWCTVPDIWYVRDRWMDRRMQKVTHLKILFETENNSHVAKPKQGEKPE